MRGWEAAEAVQGSCLNVPAAVACSQKAGEAACLCSLPPFVVSCALTVRGTRFSSSCGTAACGLLAGKRRRRRRREEKVSAAWDGDNCHGTQQSPLSPQARLCLLVKNLNINQSGYLLLKRVSWAGNLVGLYHQKMENTR